MNPYIIPSINLNAPILPNDFIKGKGLGGTTAVVRREACYDGVLDARAIHSLQTHGQEPTYDNNADTIDSTYNNGHLQMYTIHPTQPANLGDQPEYHMNQLGDRL